MPNDKDFELDDLEAFSFDDLSLDDTPPEAPADGDPLGVWVKSAPEDIGPEAEGTAEAAPELTSLPELEDLAAEDFLSSKELADLDESFDFVTVDEPLTGEDPLDDEVAFLDSDAAKAAEASEPTFDEISLDDFVSFDDVVPDEGLAKDQLLEVPTEAEPEEEHPNEDFLDIDIDIDDDIRDEDLEIDDSASPVSTKEDSAALDGFSAEEIDLSEFGDFEEVEPVTEDLLADEPTDLGPEPVVELEAEVEPEPEPEVEAAAEFDLEPEPEPVSPAVADEFEGMDGIPSLDDLPMFDDLPPLEGGGAEDGFFEEEILEEVLPTLAEEAPVSLDLEPSDETDLDHIIALEETLTEGIRDEQPEASPAPEPEVAAAPTPESELATLILGKIEQELSSIKFEISELKNELTNLRLPAAPASAVPDPIASPPEAEPQTAFASEPEETPKTAHGFFDEEDDETIALTGDELDNLLSTAEISEGEEAGLALDDDLLPLETGLEPEEPAVEISEELHVSDEEFLSGTALDLNEPDELGVPDSIELEEDTSLGLDSQDTEDLLADFDIPPLPEGVLEGQPAALEIPLEVEMGLELDTPEETVDEGWSSAGDQVAPATPTPEADLPPLPPIAPAAAASEGLTPGLKDELRAVLSYMDKLLASLPDDKIQEFAESEHFEVYKRLFEELGLIE